MGFFADIIADAGRHRHTSYAVTANTADAQDIIGLEAHQEAFAFDGPSLEHEPVPYQENAARSPTRPVVAPQEKRLREDGALASKVVVAPGEIVNVSVDSDRPVYSSSGFHSVEAGNDEGKSSSRTNGIRAFSDNVAASGNGQQPVRRVSKDNALFDTSGTVLCQPDSDPGFSHVPTRRKTGPATPPTLYDQATPPAISALADTEFESHADVMQPTDQSTPSHRMASTILPWGVSVIEGNTGNAQEGSNAASISALPIQELPIPPQAPRIELSARLQDHAAREAQRTDSPGKLAREIEPRVHIGRVEVVVVAPPLPAPRSMNGGAPHQSLASRRYLRKA